jgi:hypothetical protein
MPQDPAEPPEQPEIDTPGEAPAAVESNGAWVDSVLTVESSFSSDDQNAAKQPIVTTDTAELSAAIVGIVETPTTDSKETSPKLTVSVVEQTTLSEAESSAQNGDVLAVDNANEASRNSPPSGDITAVPNGSTQDAGFAPTDATQVSASSEPTAEQTDVSGIQVHQVDNSVEPSTTAEPQPAAKPSPDAPESPMDMDTPESAAQDDTGAATVPVDAVEEGEKARSTSFEPAISEGGSAFDVTSLAASDDVEPGAVVVTLTEMEVVESEVESEVSSPKPADATEAPAEPSDQGSVQPISDDGSNDETAPVQPMNVESAPSEHKEDLAELTNNATAESPKGGLKIFFSFLLSVSRPDPVSEPTADDIPISNERSPRSSSEPIEDQAPPQHSPERPVANHHRLSLKEKDHLKYLVKETVKVDFLASRPLYRDPNRTPSASPHTSPAQPGPSKQGPSRGRRPKKATPPTSASQVQREKTPSDVFSEDESNAAPSPGPSSISGPTQQKKHVVPVVDIPQNETPPQNQSVPSAPSSKTKSTPPKSVRWAATKTNGRTDESSAPADEPIFYVEVPHVPSLPRTPRALGELLEASSKGTKTRSATLADTGLRTYGKRGRLKRKASEAEIDYSEQSTSKKANKAAVDEASGRRQHLVRRLGSSLKRFFRA